VTLVFSHRAVRSFANIASLRRRIAPRFSRNGSARYLRAAYGVPSGASCAAMRRC
jgi:hypothetical protein